MLGGIDYTAIFSAIVAGIISIGAVTLFLKNNMPVISKWIALAKDAVETLDDISKALEPDATGKVELTTAEIEEIKADVVQFKMALAAAMAK